MTGTKVSRPKLPRGKGKELTLEAIMLRGVTPAEALKIVSQLTEFAIKISEATKTHAEEKNH